MARRRAGIRASDARFRRWRSINPTGYTQTVKTKTRVTLEEYLAMPETKPYKEFLAGEIQEKSMPAPMHARLVPLICSRLLRHLEDSGEGDVDSELRHRDEDQDWVFLPDISVTKRGRRLAPADEPRGPVVVMPDFAIEVLSPDDQAGRTARRVSQYLRAGVTLVWLVDPADESVTVFERGAEPRIVRAPEPLSAAPVLTGFALDLGSLFATLHR